MIFFFFRERGVLSDRIGFYIGEEGVCMVWSWGGATIPLLYCLCDVRFFALKMESFFAAIVRDGALSVSRGSNHIR